MGVLNGVKEIQLPIFKTAFNKLAVEFYLLVVFPKFLAVFMFL